MRVVPGVAFAVLAGFVAGCGGSGEHAKRGAPAPQATASLPPTEHVLLAGPKAGKTERGQFLKDPLGQIEQLAAGGHLVAWSVRTPADDMGKDGADRPIELPKSSKVVVVDERSGVPQTIDLGARWVAGLRFLRDGSGQRRLSILSCTTREGSSCEPELVTVTGQAKLKISARTKGREAAIRYAPTVDRNRAVVLRPQTSAMCASRFELQDLAGKVLQSLPELPPREDTCTGARTSLLVGDYAFVDVDWKAKTGSLSGTEVWGIDTAAGAGAAWHQVQAPYRYSDYGGADEIGPAVTDHALYWQDFDEDGLAYSLDVVRLPRDVTSDAWLQPSTPTTSGAIHPRGVNGCQLAATDDAVYVLENPRCTRWSPNTTAGLGGSIRRITNPVFRPEPTG